MNNKGFTLIELLASLVILGLLMGVAIPTVVNMINNNKIDTYLEDAKKLATAAEYKIRSTGRIVKPKQNNCIVISMEYLQSSDFDSAPNGGDYDQMKSFVIVRREAGAQRSYKYYVRLVEAMDSNSYNGVNLALYEDLSNSKARTLVNGLSSTPIDIYAGDNTEKNNLKTSIRNIKSKNADGTELKVSSICSAIDDIYYLN